MVLACANKKERKRDKKEKDKETFKKAVSMYGETNEIEYKAEVEGFKSKRLNHLKQFS